MTQVIGQITARSAGKDLTLEATHNMTGSIWFTTSIFRTIRTRTTPREEPPKKVESPIQWVPISNWSKVPLWKSNSWFPILNNNYLQEPINWAKLLSSKRSGHSKHSLDPVLRSLTWRNADQTLELQWRPLLQKQWVLHRPLLKRRLLVR
jgi:hypothetical protein